jgi:hypothetical protein
MIKRLRLVTSEIDYLHVAALSNMTRIVERVIIQYNDSCIRRVGRAFDRIDTVAEKSLAIP